MLVKLLYCVCLILPWQIANAKPSARTTQSKTHEVKKLQIEKAISDVLIAQGSDAFKSSIFPFIDRPMDPKTSEWINDDSLLKQYFLTNDFGDFIWQQLKSFNLKDSFKESYKAIQSIQNKAQQMEVGGGLVLFHGHVFAEGYFRANNQRLLTTKGTDLIEELTQNQPWLLWNQNRYEFQKGKTGSALYPLIAEKDGMITLYRGTNPAELGKLKQLRTSVASTITSDSDLPPVFFFTPDKTKAIKWTAGIIETIKIPKEEWTRWIKENSAFVGIEYDYIEVALFGPSAILFLIQNAEKLDDKEFAILLKNDKIESEAAPVTDSNSIVDSPDN